MKNVLILTGDAGAGHMACSNALKAAWEQKDPDANVEIVDTFQFSKLSKKYDSFLSIVSVSPIVRNLFDLGFKLIDSSQTFNNVASFFLLKRIYKPTLAIIKEKNPDIVIANNPLTAEVVTKCREVHKFNYIVTVTDIATISRWWASPNADLIFSPTKKATERLLAFSPNSNIVTDFYSLRKVVRFRAEQIEEQRKEFVKLSSFKESEPIILITGCGISTVKILRKIKDFIKKSDYQFIILTGRDTRLEKKLKEKYSEDRRIYIQGYTDKILTFFSIADVIIAKPGANTVLEIERLGQRAVFTESVAYQEVGNVEYLLENPNFVYVGSNYNLVPKKVEELLAKKKVEYYGAMKDAEDIVEYIYTQKQQTRSVLKPMCDVG